MITVLFTNYHSFAQGLRTQSDFATELKITFWWNCDQKLPCQQSACTNAHNGNVEIQKCNRLDGTGTYLIRRTFPPLPLSSFISSRRWTVKRIFLCAWKSCANVMRFSNETCSFFLKPMVKLNRRFLDFHLGPIKWHLPRWTPAVKLKLEKISMERICCWIELNKHTI